MQVLSRDEAVELLNSIKVTSIKYCDHLGKEEHCKWSRKTTIKRKVIALDDSGNEVLRKCFFQTDFKGKFTCSMHILFENNIDPDILFGPKEE